MVGALAAAIVLAMDTGFHSMVEVLLQHGAEGEDYLPWITGEPAN